MTRQAVATRRMRSEKRWRMRQATANRWIDVLCYPYVRSGLTTHSATRRTGGNDCNRDAPTGRCNAWLGRVVLSVVTSCIPLFRLGIVPATVHARTNVLEGEAESVPLAIVTEAT